MTAAPFSLTPKQERCLRVIQDLTDANAGVGPTYRQIASQLGYGGPGRIHATVHILIEKGWVSRLPNRSRSIQLLHRLAPTPPQAVNDLLSIMRVAVPNPDGTVTVTFPAPMVSALLMATPA